MNIETTIRPADPDDAAAITGIYNEGIADRGATFETAPRRVEEIAARIADERYPLLVAVDAGGAVLGWAGLSSYRPRDCYAGIAEFSIYVGREARGRGVGRPLLGGLIEVARARGFWKLVSRIFPFNAASRALCRASGFREVGYYEKHAQLDGHWLDVIIVERCIASETSREREHNIRHFRAAQLVQNVDACGAKYWGVALDKTLLTRFDVGPNSRFPAHAHESEQITHVLNGTLYVEADSHTYRIAAGDVIAIPAHVPHAVYTLSEPCVAIDAWSPVMPGYCNTSHS